MVLGGQRQRALLALLLIHAREVLSTDRIIEELWGEQPPANAKAGLHNFVAHLRRVLPSNVLVTRPPGYVVRIEPGQLDLTRFEHLVAEARGKSAQQRSKTLR